MKKVAIVLKSLDVGGIEKSAVNLLNECGKRGFKIDLFLLEKKGELLQELDSTINVFYLGKPNKTFCYSSAEAKKKGFWFFLKRSLSALWCKIFSNKAQIRKYLKTLKTIEGYNTVISYQISSSNKTLAFGSSETVLNAFESQQKIVFIHSDFVAAGLNNEYVFSQLNNFNKIIFVSKSCMDNFIEAFPQFKYKVDFMHNLQNQEKIEQLAEIGGRCDLVENKINLLTVARFSEEKAHLRTLRVLKKLHEEGFEFLYHIVGDGPEKGKIQQFVEENKLKDAVKLYGNQANPYGYIKSADVFILFSYHEAAPMVIEESYCLNVPVLSTKTISSEEMIKDKNLIFDNNEDSIYLGLKNFLNNFDKNRNIINYKVNNDEKIEKFKNIIDEFSL